MEDGLSAKRHAAATAAGVLPEDALMEILSRVPARSIHRFKCVSKHWRDLIADPLHRKRLPQTLEGFFFFSEGAGGDADTGFRGRFVSLPGSSAPLVDPSLSFLTNLPGIENIKFLGSCNGLFLFEHGIGGSEYAVCNPATEQWAAVPCPLDSPSKAGTYLIFDPAVSPHFRLVHISQKDYLGEIGVLTYSSETRVWRDIASQQSRWQDEGGWERWVNGGAILYPKPGSAFVNGMLHLVIYNFPDQKYLIAVVDMEGNTCRIITWPDHGIYLSLFGQSQGHLHCVGSLLELERGCVKWAGLSIWVLEDYDTGKWVFKHKVSFLELFGQMSFMGGLKSVLAIHPDRNLIFILENSNKKLLSYDMDSRELHAFHTLGHNFESFAPYVPNFLESLVLTNGH